MSDSSDTPNTADYAHRHLVFAWWSLALFLLLGLLLDALHGLKIGYYLDVQNSTRRLMWTLCHAHGSLLALVHVAFAYTLRTFTFADRSLYFGRDRDASSLRARVVSNRLVVFYAQSGAGKSSLINTRLAPDLRDHGFAVLPVSRVGGDLPTGVVRLGPDPDDVVATGRHLIRTWS